MTEIETELRRHDEVKWFTEGADNFIVTLGTEHTHRPSTDTVTEVVDIVGMRGELKASEEHEVQVLFDSDVLSESIVHDCPECGSDQTTKLSNDMVHCGECWEKFSYDCTNCGFLTKTSDDLEYEGGGVHSDQSKYRCPNCGKVEWQQGWLL